MYNNKNSKYYHTNLQIKKVGDKRSGYDNDVAKSDKSANDGEQKDAVKSDTDDSVDSSESKRVAYEKSKEYSVRIKRVREYSAKVAHHMGRVGVLASETLEEPAIAAITGSVFEHIENFLAGEGEEAIESAKNAVLTNVAIVSDDVIKTGSKVRVKLRDALSTGRHAILHALKAEGGVYKNGVSAMRTLAKRKPLSDDEKHALKKIGMTIAITSGAMLLHPFAEAIGAYGIGVHAISHGTAVLGGSNATSFLGGVVSDSIRASLYDIGAMSAISGVSKTAIALFKSLREDANDTDTIMNAFLDLLLDNLTDAKFDKAQLLTRMMDSTKKTLAESVYSNKIKYTEFLRECSNVLVTMIHPVSGTSIKTMPCNVKLYESSGFKVADRASMKAAMISSGDYDSFASGATRLKIIDDILDAMFNDGDVVGESESDSPILASEGTLIGYMDFLEKLKSLERAGLSVLSFDYKKTGATYTYKNSDGVKRTVKLSSDGRQTATTA
jgi:uncharacterized protein YsxB (DUF464 family)